MSHPGMVQPGEHLQRLQRTDREFTDQHGRKFFAWADKSTSQPIGEFQPMGFQPPWLPSMRYAKFRRDGDLHFVWQYHSLASELADATQRYYQEAILFALEKNILPEPEVGGPVAPKIRMVFGNPPLSPAIPMAAEQGDPWLLGVPGTPKNVVLEEILRQGVGSTSRAALELIRQSVQNLLAGTKTVAPVAQPEDTSAKPVKTIHTLDDAAVAAMLDISYPEFVKQCGGKGMKLAEIAALWKEHKAALAGSSGKAA